jgi:NADPH:quinone reductase-like Zn-dependent oxidoreductase
MDIAGVVTAVGAEVTRFRVGDEVIAMLGGAFGGHAERATVRETGAVALKPASMSFEEAVALVFGGITARAFLNQANLSEGSRVLVNGASGAVGTAAVQLAKAAGAQVTAVCSSENAGLVLSLGADAVVDYRVTDFANDGHQYDVIVDCVGNAPFERVTGALGPGGALLAVVSDLPGVLLAPVRARRSGQRVITSPGAYRSEDLEYLVQLADSGGYRPVVDRVYPLDDISSAHRYVAGGHKKGNVVVRMRPTIAETVEAGRSRAVEGEGR